MARRPLARRVFEFLRDLRHTSSRGQKSSNLGAALPERNLEEVLRLREATQNGLPSRLICMVLWDMFGKS